MISSRSNRKSFPLSGILLLGMIASPSLALAQTTWNGEGLTTTTTTASSSSATGQSCASPVQQHLTNGAQQAIEAGAAHAANDFPFMSGTFLENSCLSNMFSGLSTGLNFNPPSLSSILSQIASQACGIAQSWEDQAIMPIAQNMQTGLPAYEIAPGIAIPSLNTGFSMSDSTGGSSDSANINITPLFGNNNYSYSTQYSKGLW